MQNFIVMLLTTSITMSVLALIYIAVSPILAKRYSQKGRYYGWLIIVVGLIIPFRPHFDKPIIKVDIPSETIIPIMQIVNERFIAVTTANIPIDKTSLLSAALHISWWQVISAVWLFGVIVFIAYHGIRHYSFIKMTMRWGENILDEQILFLLQSLKYEMGINKGINLYLCPCIGSPTMMGLANPRIFLPTKDIAQDELRFILKHELVHHKRKDLLYKYLVLTATAIHWFNPVVYLAAKAIADLCEMSCDSDVVRSADKDTRLSYSEAIIGVASYQSRLKTVLSTSFYGGKKSMKIRISSIMDTHKKKTGAALFCFILIGSVFLNIAFDTSTTNSNEQAYFTNQIDSPTYPFDSEVEEIALKAKNIQLESSILNFDKVDDAAVFLFLDNEIISANIVLIITEEISYSEIDSIVLLISENVESLDKGNIQIKDQNDNTLYPRL